MGWARATRAERLHCRQVVAGAGRMVQNRARIQKCCWLALALHRVGGHSRLADGLRVCGGATASASMGGGSATNQQPTNQVARYLLLW